MTSPSPDQATNPARQASRSRGEGQYGPAAVFGVADEDVAVVRAGCLLRRSCRRRNRCSCSCARWAGYVHRSSATFPDHVPGWPVWQGLRAQRIEALCHLRHYRRITPDFARITADARRTRPRRPAQASSLRPDQLRAAARDQVLDHPRASMCSLPAALAQNQAIQDLATAQLGTRLATERGPGTGHSTPLHRQQRSPAKTGPAP